MRPGALALVVLAALLLAAGLAAAQGAPTLEASPVTPPLVKPGDEATATMTVKYCYGAPGAVAGTVTVSVQPPSGWLTGSVSPSSFRADVGSGQSCGTKDVALTLRASRDAPAFKPAALHVNLDSKGASGATKQTVTADVLVQAQYWAELEVKKPDTPRVQRSDQGTLNLPVSVGANEATRLEITSFDPARLITVRGAIVTTQAGNGLDQKAAQTIPLTVTVSPGAQRGLRQVQLNITTHYVTSPAIQGESKEFKVDVDVTDAATTPGFEAPALLLAAGAVTLLARRR